MNLMKEIKDIIIHHSQSVGGSLSFMRHIHVVENGWDDVGYHWIDNNGKSMYNRRGALTWGGKPDGKIEVGRLMKFTGAQVRGHNSHSIGICLIGNFENTVPTVKQIDSLVSLLATLCKMYRLPVDKILGHRDVGNSTCPGKNLYNLLPSIRQKVQTKLDGMGIVNSIKARFGLIGKLGKR